jgi:hypothetical protein
MAPDPTFALVGIRVVVFAVWIMITFDTLLTSVFYIANGNAENHIEEVFTSHVTPPTCCKSTIPFRKIFECFYHNIVHIFKMQCSIVQCFMPILLSIYMYFM